MDVCKSDKPGILKRFSADRAKRNPVTNVILYGISVAAVLYALAMVIELTGVVCDYSNPCPCGFYDGMTLGGLFYRMLSKGWLVGLVVCLVVFSCNQRVIRWNADGVFWMFILCFGISMSTLAVENEMFLCYTVFTIGSQALYALSLFLPKRIGENNTTTFQQCRKPANWLITLSFIVMVLWSILFLDTIFRL